ncbi:MAG: BON domain-containing protein [Vicinamibacterales bacterium]
MRPALRMLVPALLLSLSAFTSLRAQSPQADSDVRGRVEQRLLQKKIRGIKVSATGGAVTLTGALPSAGDKQDLVTDLLKVDGVEEIFSELTITRAESDRALAERAAAAVRDYSRFTVFDEIEVNVNDGVVTVAGYVTTPIKSQELQDQLSHIRGVQDLVNRIEVLPASSSDERLRTAIATVIYRDPLFTRYAEQRTPPLHIIVRNARVLLTGVVNTEAERIKAESLARGVIGVLGVQNQLRTER